MARLLCGHDRRHLEVASKTLDHYAVVALDISMHSGGSGHGGSTRMHLHQRGVLPNWNADRPPSVFSTDCNVHRSPNTELLSTKHMNCIQTGVAQVVVAGRGGGSLEGCG